MPQSDEPELDQSEGDEIEHDDELASEFERRYAMLDYLLNRTEQDSWLEQLYAIGERLNDDEEAALPEYVELEGRALEELAKGRIDSQLSQFPTDPDFADLLVRLKFQALLALVDEEPEHVERLQELIREFTQLAESDAEDAADLMDAGLAYWEDTFMEDYMELTAQADEHDHDGDTKES